MIQRRQEKKLRKRDVARRQFLAEMQDETTLHLQDDMREPFRVGAELVYAVQGRVAWLWRWRFSTRLS